MPRGDGTGPKGKGSKTGRGSCNPNSRNSGSTGHQGRESGQGSGKGPASGGRKGRGKGGRR